MLLTFRLVDEEGSSQHEQQQEKAQSHGGCCAGQGWRAGHTLLLRAEPPPIYLWMLCFRFRPSWQAAHQSAKGWVMEK